MNAKVRSTDHEPNPKIADGLSEITNHSDLLKKLIFNSLILNKLK